MKRYLLSIYQPTGGTPPPGLIEQVVADLEVLNREMKEAGAWVFAAGLHEPSTATVLRVKGGDIVATDGPFAEGKEHVGGISIIAARDLDEALQWAERLSRATTLPVEVRPFADEH
jgi:hypothetical protein